MPAKKKKKLPLVERTDSRGLVELKFPGIEATFPGTNRSVMVVLCFGICALVIIIPVCFYQVFSAEPESLERVGQILRGDGKPREPVKMPVQTNNGIEMIEVCPPCPNCDEMGCMDMCPISECQCPVCQPIPPPPLPTPSVIPDKEAPAF